MDVEDILDDGRAAVLIVDDTSENLAVLGEILQPLYRVLVANSGQRALQIVAASPRPDLILLDIMMPQMDGYAVLQALKSNPKHSDIPVMFVTALDDETNEEFGLGLGAVDYITKPVKPALLLARVQVHLALKQARDQLAHQKANLEHEVQRRVQELMALKDANAHARAALASPPQP